MQILLFTSLKIISLVASIQSRRPDLLKHYSLSHFNPISESPPLRPHTGESMLLIIFERKY